MKPGLAVQLNESEVPEALASIRFNSPSGPNEIKESDGQPEKRPELKMSTRQGTALDLKDENESSDVLIDFNSLSASNDTNDSE
jgi:hypothetical protein